jgi:hypothetical protein
MHGGSLAAVTVAIGMAMATAIAPPTAFGATRPATPSGLTSGPAPTVDTSTLAPGTPVGMARGLSDSLDWAGYAVTGAIFSSVSGSWTQPTATCHGKVSQSAFWVGIDGYLSTDPSVQQIGTDADCVKRVKKNPGGPSYYAWYELYPDGIVVLPTASYPVAPADVLTGGVTELGSSITLSIVDTGKWTFSTVQAAPEIPLDQSAEWITEAPTACVSKKCRAVDLTDFGSATFTRANAGGQPVDAAAYDDHQIMMTKNDKGTVLKASTSGLSGGEDFTVTWVNA